MSSEDLHAPREILSLETRLLHNAITSLKEELKGLLLHNMREEMEHASMLLEWIRRNNGDFAGHIETYLFSTGSILAVEKAAESRGGAPAPSAGPPSASPATIGSLKGRR